MNDDGDEIVFAVPLEAKLFQKDVVHPMGDSGSAPRGAPNPDAFERSGFDATLAPLMDLAPMSLSKSDARIMTEFSSRFEHADSDRLSRAMIRAELAFATPRKLPKPGAVKGRIVVLDVAFASEASGGGFEKITKPFIDGLGPRLAAWVDHHDHALHAHYIHDDRFVLATKAEHGACPEMVTPELCARIGNVDTIVCHTDFDGLCSAAKWLREGIEPYPGADDDARAIDTRLGIPTPTARRFDRAIRARSRDTALLGLIVRHLASGLSDDALWRPIDDAGKELDVIEKSTHELARHYRRIDILKPKIAGVTSIAYLDVARTHAPGQKSTRYDKTALLLLGQERAAIALLVDGDTLTFAAPFDSGLNFLDLLGLSGGMPTLVSVGRERLEEALARLGVAPSEVDGLR